MRIAIAYDGSEYANAAVDDLRRSGLPREADALVILVSETLLTPPTPSSPMISADVSRRVTSALVQAAQKMEDARLLANAGRERARQCFPEWDVRAETLLGAPATAVMQKADEWRADLIVVGSQGRSALGRMVLGSVSKQVATESSRSVLVARHVVERGNAPIRVIIGVDGSPGAEAAVGAVALRAWPEGTEVRVLAVDDTVRPTVSLNVIPQAAASVSQSNEACVLKAREMMERAADTLRAAGLHVSAELKKGSAQGVLCDEAHKWGADCIFVGSRGFTSALERFRTGSVSTAMVTRAPCSVEVVRWPSAPPQDQTA